MAIVDLRVDADQRARLIPTTSVIIPTLNEVKNLEWVLRRIPDWVHEVILVDGGSDDGTLEMAQHVYPDARIVLELERGKGLALRRGFEAAEGEIIVMLDADGSMDPAEMVTFVGALMSGADFVKGSRFAQGGGSDDISPLRRLGNLGFTVTVRLFFHCKYTDLCYGYNAFWSDVLPTLDLDGDGFEIETMMNVRALRSGLKVVEVPSHEGRRHFGPSNLRTFRDGWRVLKTIIAESRATEAPERTSIPPALRLNPTLRAEASFPVLDPELTVLAKSLGNSPS